MALSKEKKKAYQREYMKKRRSNKVNVRPNVRPAVVDSVRPSDSVLDPVRPEDVRPVRPMQSGIFIPLEPAYIDLLEQEYKAFGGLAEHVRKLLIGKVKQVNEKIESRKPVVEPIDPVQGE